MTATNEDFLPDAKLLKTIAHPDRLHILFILTEQPSINVSTLQDLIKLEQSVLSHHLVKMRDRGILRSERRNTTVYYYLANPTFAQVIRLILEL